ncbi:MAG: hypothetical protein HUU46_19200 [Candidatus Hydrogenedentes bacterium]|nr:hypothetical protein [Candidatus Hydrogenedentota bacterium]
MSFKKKSNRRRVSKTSKLSQKQKGPGKYASAKTANKPNATKKRKTEKNPTYGSREELGADLHAFRGRLDSVIRLVSLMFGLQKSAADDLYQTVFEKAWSDPTRVPAKRGQWSWLLKVAYRTAISTFRSNQRFVFVDLEAGLNDETMQEDCDVAVFRAVVPACSTQMCKVVPIVDVHVALSELQEEITQEVALLSLSTMGNCSVRDIEEMTGTKRTRASKMIQTAKDAYRDRFPAHREYVA